jgi:DNA-binding PadR family transcriptional regulator
MRHRDRRPDKKVERRGEGGWAGEPRRRTGPPGEPPGDPAPGGEHHGPPRHRDREGRGGRRGPGGGRSRGRALRGDVRTAILLVVADQPMHGYQIMQAMRDRTGGAWRPSPGAVYPTIAQLEDEGLVTTQEEGGRRLVTLTSEGRSYVEERSARLGDPFADFAGGASGPDLRDPLQQLHAAARQISAGGSAAQIEAAARVLGEARRSLYLILAGEADKAEE